MTAYGTYCFTLPNGSSKLRQSFLPAGLLFTAAMGAHDTSFVLMRLGPSFAL